MKFILDAFLREIKWYNLDYIFSDIEGEQAYLFAIKDNNVPDTITEYFNHTCDYYDDNGTRHFIKAVRFDHSNYANLVKVLSNAMREVYCVSSRMPDHC